MRPVRIAALLGLGILLSGCFLANRLMPPEQRLLVRNLMRNLAQGEKQLAQSVEARRWEAVARLSDEMLGSAQRLQEVRPNKGDEDFRLRAIELEHDLRLLAQEAARGNAEAVQMHVKNLELTCGSCHRKYRNGRPW
jgi:uncharacterized membrane protein